MDWDIVEAALGFIAAYGLVAIFILLVLDAAMLLPVFPGEVVLVMAVAKYATDLPNLVFLVVLTAAAGLVGSLILYGITRGGGRRLVEKYPRLFMMTRKRRERLEKTFARPMGQSLVFFLRLVPLTRVLVNIPAGLAKMPILRFVLLSGLGLLAYHAAFLWFAYEVRRPGSTLGTQKQQLQQAYADPAMEFVAANVILTCLALLVIGVVVSVRASRAMLRDPEESTGSFVGWLSTMVLLWGGFALGIAAYLEPDALVLLAEPGGLDLEALAADAGLSVTQLVSLVAAAMAVVGALLRGLSGQARQRRRRHLQEQRIRDAAGPARTPQPLGYNKPAPEGSRAPVDPDARHRTSRRDRLGAGRGR
jgi:membrane protein DedA with SNARE-associated domain